MEDITNKISNANGAFNQLQKIWKSSDILLRKKKLSTFSSDVKLVILYGCETYRVTQQIWRKLQSFTNRCFRTIVKMGWPVITTNDELWEQKNEIKITEQITRRKWNLISRKLRQENAIEKAMEWGPQ
jgi:hypothetical protein